MNGNGKMNGKQYWRSLDELAESPDFRTMVENEFPSQLPKVLSPVSRRQFLKVMGASMAMLGIAGCRWPSEEIVPFAGRPRNVDPGVPKLYATSVEMDGFGVPLVATSYDGRPVKVDGNDKHPMSLGGSSARVQASVLDLYDPDRSTHPVLTRDGKSRSATWSEFDAFAAAMGKDSRGEGFRILAEPSLSPTRMRLKARLLAAYPRARWYDWAPFPATGGDYRAVPKLENAEVIVSLDDDLLMDHPGALANTRHWARKRRGEDGTMNRLWVVESGFSVTGGAADHRLGVKPSRVPAVAAALYAAVVEKPIEGLPEADFVARMAEDLKANRGRCLVTTGAGQDPLVHEAVQRLNLALGNVWKTVDWATERDPSGLEALIAEMRAGTVSTLLILGGNPAFTAPADLDFAAALSKVDTSIHLAPGVDETSSLCSWHLNAAHYLESWDDVRAFDGTPGVVQPLIRPLYDGRTASEVLARFVGGPARKGYDLVRETWKDLFLAGGDFERGWRRVLHNGFGPTGPKGTAPLIESWKPEAREKVLGFARATPAEGMEVVFRADPCVGDGRQANNGWLQELPDPMTKLVWDNPALVSPADGKALGVKSGDRVKIAVGDRSVTVPVWIQPGLPKGSITLHAGNGRPMGGRVADGSGFDVYPLRGTDGMAFAAATVEKAAGSTKLACTHNHHAIDPIGESEAEKRMHRLIREATLEEYV
ncbi:MAG: TAT-variant-translocated molybdopterin oxidoreductase, partial [Planctomycetota bacterium]